MVSVLIFVPDLLKSAILTRDCITLGYGRTGTIQCISVFIKIYMQKYS